jgi:hypothetical protein
MIRGILPRLIQRAGAACSKLRMPAKEVVVPVLPQRLVVALGMQKLGAQMFDGRDRHRPAPRVRLVYGLDNGSLLFRRKALKTLGGGPVG